MELQYFIMGTMGAINIALAFLLQYVNRQLNKQNDVIAKNQLHLERMDQSVMWDLGKINDELIKVEIDSQRDLEDVSDNLQRMMASRLTRLEKKFENQMASGVEVKAALDVINEVKREFNEFVLMYRNQ